jgi:hypothetical protein
MSTNKPGAVMHPSPAKKKKQERKEKHVECSPFGRSSIHFEQTVP